MTSKEWQTYKLSDFMEFNPKETLAKGTIAKKIAMENLQPFCRDICQYEYAPYNGGVKFKNGDTIMARITPCLENGKTSKVNILEDNEIAFGSTEYIVFRKREGISDENFIYYLVTSPKIREIAIKSMVGSSGRQRVQADVLANLELELPPLETQEKIAKVLSSLDDKIELNNKINQNLEQQAQAIFKSWFVDFEPFGGKMPDDWRIGKVEEIINIYDSKRIPLSNKERSEMTKKVYPYYGATSLMDYVDNYIFDGTYLLLGEDGTVIDNLGFPILQYVWGKFWVNNHAHILTGKNGYSVESLYLFFKQKNIKSIVTGAVQAKISQNNLKNLDTLIPSKSTMNEFNKMITPLFDAIRNNTNENKQLTQLRDTLLPKLMSGEIDVDRVEV